MSTPNAFPFAVHYASSHDARDRLASNASVLGIIGYGTAKPDFVPISTPFVPAPLLPQDKESKFEIWTAASTCQPHRTGPVFGAVSDDLAFGAIQLAETVNTPFEDIVEQAYLNIFDFMDAAGFTAPIRFWNYLTAIIEDDRGLERYRRFNIGRQKAFSARLLQELPPAASGVGGFDGNSVIYFLAAREPALPIENPRQISAYQYPKIYGPRSPSFSRASVYSRNDTRNLFISGTASIVGHETRHEGDLPGQIAETIENMRALIAASAQPEYATPAPDAGNWALKIYLQNPDFRKAVEPAVNALFGTGAKRLYLRGELCRPGLLLEIEAFYSVVTLQPGA